MILAPSTSDVQAAPLVLCQNPGCHKPYVTLGPDVVTCAGNHHTPRSEYDKQQAARYATLSPLPPTANAANGANAANALMVANGAVRRQVPPTANGANGRDEPPPLAVGSFGTDDAERVLGCILSGYPEVFGAIDGAKLRAEDFYHLRHRELWKRCRKLHAQGIATTIETVRTSLDRRAIDGIEGYDLVRLRDLPDNWTLAPAYVQALKLSAVRRRLDVLRARVALATEAPAEELAAVLGEIGRAIAEATALAGEAGVAGVVTRQPIDQRATTLETLLATQYPPLTPIVDGLIYEGTSIIVSGRSKDGKSYLALGLAVAIATGHPALGAIPVDRPRDVLYLCLEDGERRAQRRAQAMLDVRGLAAGVCGGRLTFLWHAPRINEGLTDELREWATAHPGGLIIVDILERVRPIRGQNVYADDYSALSPLTDVAHDTGAAVVVLTHNNKMKGGDGVSPLDLISGSMGQPGAVDGALIFRPRNHGAREAVVSFVHRDVEPRDYELVWDDWLAGWRSNGESKAEDAPKVSEAQVALIEAFAVAGGRTPTEAAKILNRPANAVRVMLHKLKGRGWLVEQDGRYVPTKEGLEAAGLGALAPISTISGISTISTISGEGNGGGDGAPEADTPQAATPLPEKPPAGTPCVVCAAASEPGDEVAPAMKYDANRRPLCGEDWLSWNAGEEG